MQKNNKNERDKTVCGKFASAEELLAAYNALESEFTKRCQLIKQLQAAAQPSDAQAQKPAEQDSGEVSDGPSVRAEDIAEGDVPNGGADTSDGDGEQGSEGPELSDIIVMHAAEFAEALSAVPEVMDACIAKYKRDLLGARRGAAPLAGMAVITPAKRPRTLAEAKALADKILK